MSAENVTLTSRMEQRVVIKHCVPIGMTPMDTQVCLHGLIEAKLFNGISVSMTQYIKRRV